MLNDNINDDHSNLFSYKEPEINEDINLFQSNQVPWFYHLIHILQLKKDDFINIKNFVENEKSRGNEYNHVLNIIDYKTYQDEILKINSNSKNTLSAYLYSCKYFLSQYSKNIESNKNVHFVFVFGNITADLDSVCSSIIYSFFLYIWFCLKKKAEKKKNIDEIKFFIPVINIKKNDIKLKILITWWLRKSEILSDEDVFVFQDDIHLLEVLKHNNKYDICLVDFNDFEVNNIYNINNVKSIIDHHMIKEGSENKRITKSIYPIYICSCMVIIAYLYKNSSEFLGIPFINKNMMWLIYGTILRDSNNFIREDFGKRWIQPDLNIFLSLKKFYKISNKMDIYLTYKYKSIRFSVDLRKFGIENLLFCDYKDYNYQVSQKKIKIRIASIDFSVDLLFSNENVNRLIKELYELCEENNFSIFIFIGSYFNHYKLNKDMGLFFYKNDVNKDDLLDTLLTNKDIKLSNKSFKNITYNNNSKTVDIFQINNQNYSRKKLEYLLYEFFF
ncbi:conserved Plasmodium protein, unknown function [Plasmodium gallinaceum]|uniref:DDH domain-containing protein n=1 Tax=Plasmodium gallinaceum TaxID=5849 RepID=A0A1J1GSN7_PLAGA|nr:conserved Plasmodium protein, unknown function [Plasmodium gallinaceum]CRG95541.1 conserved Plasmodium protein, unknown function [Plasmodium gallinaceum]